MTKPRYQILPQGILVNTEGLGLHFTRKRKAERTLKTLRARHPLAGYHLRDLHAEGVS